MFAGIFKRIFMNNNDKYKDLREQMVEDQIIARGIKNKAVIDIMKSIPRDNFVSKNLRSSSYDDHPLPIGDDQTISQPYMAALMSELINTDKEKTVLEIGTGSGYQTSILAKLSKFVYTVDRIPQIVERAKTNLKRININNIDFNTGDGTLGWAEKAPFDRIMVTAGAPCIPEPLIEQLGDGGLLVIPVGSLYSQTLKIIKRIKNKIEEVNSIECIFVKLIGKYGWSNKKI